MDGYDYLAGFLLFFLFFIYIVWFGFTVKEENQKENHYLRFEESLSALNLEGAVSTLIPDKF